MTEITTAADLLRAARALLAQPEAWTQGRGWGEKYTMATALSAFGNTAVETSDEAWGLLVAAIAMEKPGADCARIYNNDPNRTHAEVLAVYDRAIEMAEKGR